MNVPKIVSGRLVEVWSGPNTNLLGKQQQKTEMIRQFAAAGHTCESSYFHSLTDVSHVSTHKTGKRWMSWKQLCDKEGEDDAALLVQNRKVDVRDHVMHGPNSGKYQFSYLEEEETDANSVTDRTRLGANHEATPESMSAFQRFISTVRDVRAGSVTTAVAQAGTENNGDAQTNSRRGGRKKFAEPPRPDDPQAAEVVPIELTPEEAQAKLEKEEVDKCKDSMSKARARFEKHRQDPGGSKGGSKGGWH